MRVIFFGTPEFAVPSLQALLSSRYQVCTVVTQPDRPAGRGQRLRASAIKDLALAHGLPVLQPEKVSRPENLAVLERYNPQFLVVVAFGQILPRQLLDLPSIGPLNVHASLLPRYRGAAPVNWALVRGERWSGVTTMVMEETLDTGPILLQQRLEIPDTMTAGELSLELARMGAAILVPSLDGLREGSLVPVRQDDSQACYAPRIRKEMARISWDADAVAVHNLIRGLNPWPTAYSEFRGEQLRVLRSRPLPGEKSSTAAGTFLGLGEQGIRVQCGGRSVLELLEVQLPGKSRISGRAFASGARLDAGEILFGSNPG